MITPDMMLTMPVDDHSSNKVTAIPISNTHTAPATVKEGRTNFSSGNKAVANDEEAEE